MTKMNDTWIINCFATNGKLSGDELHLVTIPIPELGDGEVLLKTKLLTLDPSNRLWLSEAKDYLPQLQIGDVMRGVVIAEVEQSKHKQFYQGQFVIALLGWQKYTVIHGDKLTPENYAFSFTPHPEIPLDTYASALGLTGWTAFVGLEYIARVKAGDNVLVSGAAGATGLLACQLAKAKGGRIIGIAGGQRKCDLLVEQFELDGVIDYKNCNSLSDAFQTQFPQGIDVFFDNVGGEILDAALENMALRGRIVISGSISQYQHFGDKKETYGLQNTFYIASKHLRMEGFLILDYMDKLSEILPIMEQWLLAGKIKDQNTIIDGLENAQETLPRIFTGDHLGKLLINVATE